MKKEISLEKLKNDLSISKETELLGHNFFHNTQIENFKTVISVSQFVIKFILILNGAALISMLTFMSNLISNGQNVSLFEEGVTCFIFGLICGVCGGCGMYLTQALYAEASYADPNIEEGQRRRIKMVEWGDALKGITITVCASSIIFFAYGALITKDSIVELKNTICLPSKEKIFR